MKSSDFDAAVDKVARLATSECFRLGDQVVGTEYLLMALLKETPAERLALAGIDRTELVAVLEELLQPRREHWQHVVLLGKPGCQTPRYKKAITAGWERASAESRQVELRDLWWGLLSDPQSEAMIFLALRKIAVDTLLKFLA